MFRRRRPAGDAPSGADAEVDRIVSVRLLRATRRTEKLMRRIDALERRVQDLEGHVAEAERSGGRFRRALEARGGDPLEESSPGASPGSAEGPPDEGVPGASQGGAGHPLDHGRPSAPAGAPGRAGAEGVGGAQAEGARLVAAQMLDSGIPPAEVAAHLEEAYDLPDPERVVEDVAAGKQ